MADPLAVRAHRPWPLPARPWAMAMRWHDLLLAHWSVDVDALRASIPPGLALDTYDGRAWVGVVPFRMTGVRPRFVPPLPWLSAFPELNVRTYVTCGGRPGIWFFSLDAANALAVLAARRTFHLPYFRARMRCERDGERVRYASERTHGGAPPAVFEGSYAPIGPPAPAAPGSLEEFLVERYCLYALDPRGRVLRGEIHHAPWPLQPAEATIERESTARAAGIALRDEPPLLHFARRLDVVAWWVERCDSGDDSGDERVERR